MNRAVLAGFAALAAIIFVVAPVGAEPMWHREATIDLTPWFGVDSTNNVAGSHPWAVDTDGARAFIGGYNNSPDERTIGVAIIDDLRGTPIGMVPEALVTNVPIQGVYFTAWDDTRDALYTGFDSGGSAGIHSWVVKTDAAGVIDTTFGPDQITCATEPSGDGYSRPPTIETSSDIGRFTGGIAIDPGDPDDPDPDLFPGVSYAFRGNGRRTMLDGDDGTVTYRASLDDLYGCADTAIDFGFVYTYIGPPWYTLYRGHAFDMDTGDCYLRTHNYVYKAERTAKNAAAGVAETPLIGPAQGFVEAVDPVVISGLFVEVIPASSGVTGAPIVACNSRPDYTGNTGAVQLRSAADGSTTGLGQTELTGAEDGGTAYSVDVGIFSMAYGVDPDNGDPVLLVCSMEDRRLDVFVWGEGAAGAIALTDIRRGAGGAIEIQWDDASGTFDIERATDLVTADWGLLDSVTDTDIYSDPAPPDPQGFYRVAPAE